MSLDRVKTTVLEEARARAAEKLQQARQEASRFLSEGDTHDHRVGEEAIRDAKLRLERETLRELERIQHDNRLHILSAKNQAIDEVFKRVTARLDSLTDAKYLKLIASWLNALPADVGGTLRVNPRDFDKFKNGLDALNKNRPESGKFTDVTPDPKIVNGAVVDGPDYNIDCTISRRLNELRESSAGDLAKVLFGA